MDTQFSVVPPGLISFCTFHPQLKLRAIFGRLGEAECAASASVPGSGTGVWECGDVSPQSKDAKGKAPLGVPAGLGKLTQLICGGGTGWPPNSWRSEFHQIIAGIQQAQSLGKIRGKNLAQRGFRGVAAGQPDYFWRTAVTI